MPPSVRKNNTLALGRHLIISINGDSAHYVASSYTAPCVLCKATVSYAKAAMQFILQKQAVSSFACSYVYINRKLYAGRLVNAL